jgi:ABC-2 type transport system permease protein
MLLCGLFLDRDVLPGPLSALSDVLPLSYAVDAMTRVALGAGDLAGVSGQVWTDLAVVGGFVLVLLGLGAATLRRRTA